MRVLVDAKPYGDVPDSVLNALGDRLSIEAVFTLQSSYASFGGFSGLWIDDTGGYAVMVSDVGQRWQAMLLHDGDGRLIGLKNWSVADLRRRPNENRGRRWFDSESLSGDGLGHLIVAYEGNHRLRRWPISDLDRVPEPVALPEGLGAAGNSGIEALSSLPGGRLLALAERVGTRRGDGQMGWVIDGGEARDLMYVPAPDFAPTGAGRLDNRIYVVERSFSLLDGFRNRIVSLVVEDIRPGATLEGEELAAFRWGRLGENFEAIAAHRGPDGRIRLYLLADDNFSFLQQTLLVQMILDPEAAAF